MPSGAGLGPDDGTRQTYNLIERDHLIKTIAFEAPNEPDKGKAAVAYVVLKRKKSSRWADNIKDMVMQPCQFEPWMTRRNYLQVIRVIGLLRELQMPFSMGWFLIPRRAQHTSSIRSSFGRGVEAPPVVGRWQRTLNR